MTRSWPDLLTRGFLLAVAAAIFGGMVASILTGCVAASGGRQQAEFPISPVSDVSSCLPPSGAAVPTVTAPSSRPAPAPLSVAAPRLSQQSGTGNTVLDFLATFLATVQTQASASATVEAEATGVRTRDVAAVKKSVNEGGKGNVGGGTDTVTSWIYAVGAIVIILAYPLILRPLGLKLPSPVERRERRVSRFRKHSANLFGPRGSHTPPTRGADDG